MWLFLLSRLSIAMTVILTVCFCLSRYLTCLNMFRNMNPRNLIIPLETFSNLVKLIVINVTEILFCRSNSSYLSRPLSYHLFTWQVTLLCFSLVKMVFGFASRSNSMPTWCELQHAILRNFGGLDDVKPVEVFAEHLRQIDKHAAVCSAVICSHMSYIWSCITSHRFGKDMTLGLVPSWDIKDHKERKGKKKQVQGFHI